MDSDQTAVAAFKRRVADHGSISFRSYNGKAYRRDDDTELTFYSNGRACMLDYGLTGEAYWGDYHIHADGCLVSWFKGFRSEWPVMVIRQDADHLILLPPNEPNGFPPTPPEAATRPAEQRFWRFRILSGEDEKQALETAKRWSGSE